MQDADADDKMTAQAIRDALKTLNERLKFASLVGLFVDIEVMSGHEIGSPAPQVIVMAKIERRSTL